MLNLIDHVVQEEMHLVWKGHPWWKKWAAAKDQRMAAAANQPGTEMYEDYKVNEHAHGDAANGNSGLKPV